MSGHTPGPWRLSDESGTGIYVMADNASNDVALVYQQEAAAIEANARLIAAAPDLLDACKALMVEADRSTGSIESLVDAYRLISAAIAKAEGR